MPENLTFTLDFISSLRLSCLMLLSLDSCVDNYIVYIAIKKLNVYFN